tara:strand:- start:1001 stop:2482 length:1482 start_codon:yes stop_codon:yes gene_type:complete
MNKKGLIAMGLSLMVFTSLLLVMFSLQMSRKTVPYTGQTGELQSEQLQAIASGHKALLFLDQGAEYALQDTIVEFFSDAGGVCDNGVWESIDEDDRSKAIEDRTRQRCTPREGALQESFEGLFNAQLDGYLSNFPRKNIPLNNIDLVYEENEDGLEVIGFGTKDVVFPSARAASLISEAAIGLKRQNAARRSKDSAEQVCNKKLKGCDEYTTEIRCDFDPCNVGCYWEDHCREIENVVYAIKPAFRISSDYDFLEGILNVKKTLFRFREEIRGCLMQANDYNVVHEGSDIEWCSRAILGKENGVEGDTTLARMVSEFSVFTVTATDNKQDYVLVFEIEDDSFSHRWDGTGVRIKIGMQFWDEFKPLAYTGFQQEEVEGKKTGRLVWDKNPASDVKKIILFAKQKGEGKCSEGENFLPFREIEYDSEESEPYFDPLFFPFEEIGITLEEQTDGKPDLLKETCFVIIAEDDAGSLNEFGNFGEGAYTTYIAPPIN